MDSSSWLRSRDPLCEVNARFDSSEHGQEIYVHGNGPDMAQRTDYMKPNGERRIVSEAVEEGFLPPLEFF